MSRASQCLPGLSPRVLPIVLIVIAQAGCLAYPTDREPLGGIPASDPGPLYDEHFDRDEYFNPWSRFPVAAGDLIRMALTANPYGDEVDEPTPFVANDGSELATPQASSKLTWVGHATFAIHDGPDVVLTDPHFTPRAAIPKRVVPPGLPVESIPADAMAVISHNHYDHLDAGTVDALPETVAWFVPMGLAEWFRDRGRANVVELDWWQSVRHGRWEITCLPSQHWSRRLEHGTNETLWCSWLLDSGDYRYYFAGDTGYFAGFAEFGRRYAPIDVALLPIGAYEPRWFMGYQHVDPAEAVQAFQDLGARYMLPMHWGTFELTHEPLQEPPRALRRALEEAVIDPERAPILAVGEGWHVPLEARSKLRSDRSPGPVQ